MVRYNVGCYFNFPKPVDTFFVPEYIVNFLGSIAAAKKKMHSLLCGTINMS